MTDLVVVDKADLDSGKVVQNQIGTFWFKDGGKNTEADGSPIVANLHRDGGPAAVGIGGKLYYTDGKPNRLGGPAVEWANGDVQYWVDGKQYTKDEFDALPK